ncbi:MAG: hypothetical protein M1837_006398 [Sclerophora amabilis]|nr:MAG: hypothetical protein M1837_006398 [Sclerophora amabilis]
MVRDDTQVTDPTPEVLDGLFPGLSVISNIFVEHLHDCFTVAVAICGFIYGLLVTFDKIWPWVKPTLVSTVLVRSDDDLFAAILKWLENRHLSQDMRSTKASTRPLISPSVTSGLDAENYLSFSPGEGTHSFREDGRLYYLRRKVEVRETRPNGPPLESLTITTLRGGRRDLHRLFNRAKKAYDAQQPLQVFSPEGEMRRPFSPWCLARIDRGRPLESVVLDLKMGEEMIEDIEWYLSPEGRAWYHHRHFPQRWGYLFHGPPGNRKSTFAQVIARHFRLDLYIINAADLGLNDESIRLLFRTLPTCCIVLLEDLEARSNISKYISISGLLAVIDSPIAPEGRLLIVTTNNIDELDTKLIRAGRIDKKYLFDNATKMQVEAIFRNTFPSNQFDGIDSFASQIRDAVPDRRVSVAELQNYLRDHVNSPGRAVEEVRTWLQAQNISTM